MEYGNFIYFVITDKTIKSDTRDIGLLDEWLDKWTMFIQMLPRERSNLIKPGLPQITHLNICISRETKEFDAIGSWMNRKLTYSNVWI